MKNITAILLLSFVAASASFAAPSVNNWSNCTYYSTTYGGIKMGEGIIGTGDYASYSFVKFVKNFYPFSQDVVVTEIDKSKNEVSVQTKDGSVLFIYSFNADVTSTEVLQGKLYSLRDNERSLIGKAVCSGPLK